MEASARGANSEFRKVLCGMLEGRRRIRGGDVEVSGGSQKRKAKGRRTKPGMTGQRLDTNQDKLTGKGKGDLVCPCGDVNGRSSWTRSKDTKMMLRIEIYNL